MGGGGQNTTTQKSDPWYEQQPYLVSGYAQAAKNLQAGPSPTSPYTTQAIQGYSDYTSSQPYRQGIDIQQAIAGGQTGSENVTPFFWDAAQGNALNDRGMNTLDSIAGNGAGTGAYGDVFRGIANNSSIDPQAGGLLRSVAAGEHLTDRNPFFQQQVDNSIAAARPSMDSAFASTGRLGSGAQAAAFADAATRTAGNLGYQDYSAERSRQDAAISQLINAGFTDKGIQLNAAGAGANLANSDANLRLSAGQGLLSSGLQQGAQQLQGAQGLLGSQQNDLASRMQAAQQLQQAGLLGPQAQAQAAQLAGAEQQRLDPNSQLAKYMALINGNVGATTETTGPGQDNTAAYVGAGASVAATAAAAAIAI